MNDLPNTQEQVFLVKKPPTNDPRQIRDAILREHFGYTNEEIKLLDEFNPVFFTVNQRKSKLTWATVDQVSKWSTDAQGNVSIPLPTALVKKLQDFRIRTMAAQIYNAVSLIADSETRARVEAYLKEILDPFSTKRSEAISNLLNETSGNTAAAEEISNALGYLSEKGGYRDNALLALARANAALTVYRTRSGPGYDANLQILLADVTRITTGNFNSTTNNPAASVTRQEAGFISRHTSWIYSQMGNETQARERDWLARFYSITDDERAAVDEGDMIEFISPIQTVGTPRPLTSAERDLATLNQNEANRRAADDATDKIGSQIVPTDHRSGELFQRPTDGFETQATRAKKIRQGQAGYKGQYKFVIYKENPYQRANVLADGYGAALELPVKFGKWVTTLRRLDELTRYLQERDRLQRRIRADNRYIIPPRPETVAKLVEQVRRYGRVTANPNAKTSAQMTLRELEQLWEESNAFWKNKK